MPVIVKDLRNNILENEYYGRICVVDDRGRVVLYAGNTEAMTFYRSSSKPIQTLPIIYHGLDEKYGFTNRELALMCASHAGEPEQIETVLSIMEKTGYHEDELIMKPAYPDGEKFKNEMIKKGLPPRRHIHNCSGKHLASMSLSDHLTGQHVDYYKPESAAQREILSTISVMSEYDNPQIGIDGCGIPVFAVPLRNIAVSYMHMAAPDTIKDDKLAHAAKRVSESMNEYPRIVRGTGYLCGTINEDTNIVAKGGAMGVYGFGLKKERLGISIKIEDGSQHHWPIIISHILKTLGYDNKWIIDKIEALAQYELLNDNNSVVGTSHFCTELQRP